MHLCLVKKMLDAFAVIKCAEKMILLPLMYEKDLS